MGSRPCLDLAGRPGWQNMAIDQVMLDRANRGERRLRLYRWAPHCLSFGRHEPALRRYDRARIDRLGLDVVRRPTGGRAVWHAEELTYAVAAPSETFGGLRQAYEEIHRMLLAALRLLGVRAELAPARRAAGPDAGSCFASPVGGEIVIGGRKVVGSAQLREGVGLLQHGSILLAGRQTTVREVTRGEAPPDLSGPLEETAGHALEASDLADAVRAAAADRWGGTWTAPAASAELLDEAADHQRRFRSAEWTWRS
ncbi:MAG: lipoate--protein ligase family protein [Gemmatimonadales bacterium]|nr:lipoate--protein ligase family protein [Gemmatimonadales bacterium]